MLLWTIALLVIADTTPAFSKKYDGPWPPKEPGHPIVIVPGDAGSQIEANLTGKPEVVHPYCNRETPDYFGLWLNLEFFLPGLIDCWVDNMKLIYNTTEGTTSNMPGVDTRIPGFGDTQTVEWLDKSKVCVSRYFAPVVEMLVMLGYKRGDSVMGAPYDWRRAPNEQTEYYGMLKMLVEKAYYKNGNKRVVIVAHSMGNPLMLYFYNNVVSQSWKNKFLKAHISLAGAWGGAIQIVRLFASGYNMGEPQVLVPPEKVRIMQRTFTSSSFLFPSYNLWNKTEAFAFTDTKNYSLGNVKEFFEDIKYEDGISQYDKTAYLLGKLNAPNVEVHCIYGFNVPTPELLRWSKDQFPDQQPTVTFGDGDGTVNHRSLDVCSQWIGHNGGKNVTVYTLEGTDHHAILQHATTWEIITKVAYDFPSSLE